MSLHVHPKRVKDAKYWRFKYRYGGKERLLALGVYPATSLKQARENLEDAKRALREGKDPCALRKAAKSERKIAAANSFEAVARAHVAARAGKWSRGHAVTFLHRLEKDLFPAFGTRPISEIKPPEVLAALRKIEARGSYDMAHRALQICGPIFLYGIASGVCEREPSRGLKDALTPHTKRNMARVSKEEVPRLLAAIDAYEVEQGGSALTRLALQLMALTFVRTNEPIEAQWTEFDFERATWTVPVARRKLTRKRKEDPHTKPHIVSLSRQAIAVLTELKAISGEGRFLFPGRNGGKAMSNNTMLFALRNMGYKGRMTGHGFRGVASTILNEARHPNGARMFDKDAIERQLSHEEKDRTCGAYDHSEHLTERAAMMQWWGDHLDTLRGANIVPFAPASARKA